MKIVYTPYRGEIEPIVNIHECSIKLLDKYIEIAAYYEYKSVDEDGIVTDPDVVKGLDFFPKAGLSVSIEGITHKADKDNGIFSRLKVCTMTGECAYVSASDSEVFELYNKIKDWLLYEVSTS